MSEPVDSRAVLVTGASRGIGRAIAERFAEEGWQVFAGARNPDQCEEYRHSTISVLRLDVTEADSVRAAVTTAEAAAGGSLDCIVNNAGWALFGAVEDVSIPSVRDQFETNFFGALTVVQAALPAMLRAERGAVVNVSSLAGRIPLPLFGMYSASKAALAAMSDALALEMAPTGIRVIHVEAGVVRTEFARSTQISGSTAYPESRYSAPRDQLLALLRSARETTGLEADQVAASIHGALGDPAGPVRLVLADLALEPLATVVGGPSPDAHEQVRRVLGHDERSPR